MEEVYNVTIDGLTGKKGLDAVAFTDDPAIEVRGFYFSGQKKKVVASEEEQNKIIDHLAGCGKTTLPKSWKEVTEEDYNANKHKLQKFETIDIADIVTPQLDSVFDVYDVEGGGVWHLRYAYDGPVDEKNRSFCSRIMGMNKTYTYEEINANLSNAEFGNYSIFDYKGSYGCRHTWKRKFYYEDFEDNEERAVGNITKVTRNLIGIDDNARTLNAKLTSHLSFVNTHKMRVCAPAMIPDLEIYRNDEYGEYKVVFTKDEIEKLVVDFQSKHIKEAFNVNHDSKDLAPAYILESWIIEDENDKAYSKYNFNKKDVPVGSWMIISQITDAEFFQKRIIEEGNFGYSVEGLFDLDLRLNKNKVRNLYKKVKDMANKKNSVKTMLKKQAFRKLIKQRFSEIKEEELEEIVDAIVESDEITKAEVEEIIVDVLGEPELEAPEAPEKVEEEMESEEEPEKKKEELEKKEEELETEVVEVVPTEPAADIYADLKAYIDSKFTELIEVISEIESSKAKEEVIDEGDIIPFTMAEKFKKLRNLNK